MVDDIAYNNNEIVGIKRAERYDTTGKKETVANLNKKDMRSPLHAPERKFVLPDKTNLIVQRQIFPKIGRLKIK